MSIYSENKQAIMELRDGILYFTFKPDTVLDQTLAETIVRERIIFQKQKSYPVFCNITEIKSFDKSARNYVFSVGTEYIRALSLFSSSPLSARIGEFYLRTYPIAIPCRCFTNMMQALTFLKPYRQTDKKMM